MIRFSETHLTILLLTIAFIALTMFIVSKLSRGGQNVMFVIGALLCSGGIFFRYGMGLSVEGALTWKTLAQQQLQVCNFNFILVLLMLVPKFELARQYSFMFSMFAASTALISVPNDWKTLNWYDLTVLNSWINHTFAITLPLWMLASGRFKPQKKYVIPITLCVTAYFSIVYAVSELLLSLGEMTMKKTYSFVYDPGGVGLLEWLYDLIGKPYYYLWPLFLPMLAFFGMLAWLFRNRSVEPYGLKEAMEAAQQEEMEFAVQMAEAEAATQEPESMLAEWIEEKKEETAE